MVQDRQVTPRRNADEQDKAQRLDHHELWIVMTSTFNKKYSKPGRRYVRCRAKGFSFLLAAATAAEENMDDADTAFLFFCQFFANALESPKCTKLAAAVSSDDSGNNLTASCSPSAFRCCSLCLSSFFTPLHMQSHHLSILLRKVGLFLPRYCQIGSGA